MSEQLAFDAIVYKVQTLVDNGLRVTLDLPEYEILAATLLMALKRDSKPLRIVARVDDDCKASENKPIDIPERLKRKSQRTTAQGPNTSRSTE